MTNQAELSDKRHVFVYIFSMEVWSQDNGGAFVWFRSSMKNSHDNEDDTLE